jgi:dolichol-phosphate mannosyltransferase
MTRPIHFFGGVGILAFLMSFFTFGVAGYFKLMGEKDFVETPLPILSAMFFTVGVLMVLLGIISEIMMRTYFESQNSAPFSIRDRVNF